MKPEVDEEQLPSKVTDIKAAQNNIDTAVTDFARRWISLPTMVMPCEVMDQGQLRDAMGLHATIDLGDPWPQAEKLLLNMGFRWHTLGGSRVMFLRESEDVIEDDGWQDGEEVEEW